MEEILNSGIKLSTSTGAGFLPSTVCLKPLKIGVLGVRGPNLQRHKRLLGGSSHDLDTWLIIIVIVSPLNWHNVGPLPNGLYI